MPERDADRTLAVFGLHWDKDAGAIICISCKYALQTKGERVSRHLGERHDVPAKARKGLSAFMKHLSLTDPNQLDRRHDLCTPHPYLAVQNGAACKRCHYRSTSVELVLSSHVKNAPLQERSQALASRLYRYRCTAPELDINRSTGLLSPSRGLEPGRLDLNPRSSRPIRCTLRSITRRSRPLLAWSVTYSMNSTAHTHLNKLPGAI